MPINDYKELTVPVSGTNKAVKMIQDSNGNIIWGSQSAFPYRLLEYISSDGTGQYIDTNYKPLSGDVIEIKMLYNVVSTEQESGMSYNVGGNPSRAFAGVQDGYGTYGRGSKAAKSSLSIAANTAVVQKIEKLSNTSIRYTINNNSITDSSLTSLNDCEYSFAICARKITASTYDKPFLGGNIYYVKLGSSRNMVPVQRKSDNVVGLYDKVNGVFYTNNGTGSFTAGPLVDEYWDLIS